MNNEFNNQENSGPQVIAMEKKKTNILAVLGLVFAFFIPLVGLILSIVGLTQAKKMNDGKGLALGGIITSAIMLALQIILFIVVIFLLVFVDDYDYNYDYYDNNNYAYREAFDYSNFANQDGKYYIVKSDYGYYVSSSSDTYGNIIGSYECDSIFCRVFDASSNYALIYDNKDYFLYDYKKDKKKSLSIPYEKYHFLYLASNNDEDTLGIVLTDEEYNQAYYDLKKDKMIVDFGVYSDIRTTADLLSAGYIGVSNDGFDEDKKIFNLDKEKVEKEGILGVFSNGKVTYFYDGELSDGEKITKIYSKDFKLIVDLGEYSCYDYYFSSDGKLLYSDDNKFYIIENNKVNYTSKSYKNVYNVLKDYVVVNKDNDLVILDYKENEVVKLVTLNDNMRVHDFLSGWYTENGKNGVYVVVEDASFSCDSLDDNNSIESCEEFGGGYEYFYIPTTKETGKIATAIGGYAKPVLYLYPENDNTKVSVSFKNSKLLTTTYPKYNKYWEVIANKNGDLYDEKGRYYYGLYWEEIGSTKVDFKEGFYVDKNNAINFLEEKTEILGFTEREANEFIMYWLPILEKNEKNLVYFELTEERENFNKLNIEPKPDSMLRVAIHVKKVDKKTAIKEQKLSTFKRHGFTVVEWGGVVH